MQRVVVPFSVRKGAGAAKHADGHYGIALNVDCRYGYAQMGPQEVADVTGIDAAYRIVAHCVHYGSHIIAGTNGTDTKIYQFDTTWKTIATISSRVIAGPQALISFNGILAVGFGSGNPYQFSNESTTDGSAYTFDASTKSAANADSANAFWIQSSGVITPRVCYVTSPNQVYFTEDLTDSDATGSTATELGTDNSTDNYVTSVIEDDAGRLLVGTRHVLWSLRGDYSKPERAILEDFPDSPNKAGGQSDRLNFENPQMIEGRVYYTVSGSEVIEYDHGHVNKYMHPKYQCKGIPRAYLPVNTMLAVGNTLLLWIGSKNTASNRSVTYVPGGTARTSNSFGTTSELWYGQYVEDETGTRWTWHGVVLVCTDPLRYAWFNDATEFVYEASGDSESADAQQRRFRFFKDNPTIELSSSQLILSLQTGYLEFLGVDLGQPFDLKDPKHIYLNTIGLATSNTIEVEYRTADIFMNTAYETDFVTFKTDEDALNGAAFPRDSRFRTMDVRFVFTPQDASTDLFPFLYHAELDVELTTERSQRARK